ncbi:MAG: glycosyltransferase family 39 protein [Anaerolineae bacterium]|nr:glycosyltransferase family 39 protein [Anaerolineae bacterium]
MMFRTALLVMVITMIGFFLRLHNLAVTPLRGDEAFSILYWARLPLGESLTNIATIEPHPAFIYALFRGWGLLFGTTEFSMRLLPALFNLLGIPALYILGTQLGGKHVGLLAALLFALHPFEIWHAQDARNNGIWAGLSALALITGLRALQQPNNRWRWLLYGILAALAANVFYFDLLTLSAFGFYVLVSHRKTFGRWIIATLPAFVTAIGSFLILQGNLVATGTYSGTIAGQLDIPRLFTTFLPTLTFGETLPLDIVNIVWPFITLVLGIGLVSLWRWKPKSALFLSIIGFVPPLLFSLAAIRMNIFTPRYLLAVIPAYIVIVATLITCLWQMRRTTLRWIGVTVCITWIGLSGYSIYNYVAVPAYAKSRDWPALTDYLAANVTASDLVIQLSVDSAFGYYYNAPADDIALPGYPTQPADEIERILTTESEKRRGIWIVGQTFPDWPSAGVVENWLDSNMQLVREGQADDLKFRQYMRWSVSANELTPQPLANFDDSIELVGAQTFLSPDRNLTIWLYWRPQQQMATPLKIFVHLIGAVNPATGSPLWSQDDQYPQDGRISTTDWTSGEIYRDVYTLPLVSVAPGDYEIHVGFYEPETNARLPIGDSDSYLLTTLTIP